MNMVRSMILPFHRFEIILPNVAVAEIVSAVDVCTVTDAKDWLLGFSQWRGINVPVISLEVMTKKNQPDVSPEANFAILNMIDGCDHHPFMGLLLQGYPRLVRILEHDIEIVDKLQDRFFKFKIMLQRQDVLMIDLGVVQQSVIAELKTMGLSE